MRKALKYVPFLLLLFAVTVTADSIACENISFNPEASWYWVFHDLLECIGGYIVYVI